jgi:hypothetical protein
MDKVACCIIRSRHRPGTRQEPVRRLFPRRDCEGRRDSARFTSSVGARPGSRRQLVHGPWPRSRSRMRLLQVGRVHLARIIWHLRTFFRREVRNCLRPPTSCRAYLGRGQLPVTARRAKPGKPFRAAGVGQSGQSPDIHRELQHGHPRVGREKEGAALLRTVTGVGAKAVGLGRLVGRLSTEPFHLAVRVDEKLRIIAQERGSAVRLRPAVSVDREVATSICKNARSFRWLQRAHGARPDNDSGAISNASAPRSSQNRIVRHG